MLSLFVCLSVQHQNSPVNKIVPPINEILFVMTLKQSERDTVL